MNIGNVPIGELFVDSMGIKEVYVGETLIHERAGGHFYIELTA